MKRELAATVRSMIISFILLIVSLSAVFKQINRIVSAVHTICGGAGFLHVNGAEPRRALLSELDPWRQV